MPKITTRITITRDDEDIEVEVTGDYYQGQLEDVTIAYDGKLTDHQYVLACEALEREFNGGRTWSA